MSTQPPTKFENLTPLTALNTSAPIRWTPTTKHKILAFCAREKLSQHSLCPTLLSHLMRVLGWHHTLHGDPGLPLYEALLRRVVRFVCTHVSMSKLGGAIEEVQGGGGAARWSCRWKTYTRAWSLEGWDGNTGRPAGDDGAWRSAVEREAVSEKEVAGRVLELVRGQLNRGGGEQVGSQTRPLDLTGGDDGRATRSSSAAGHSGSTPAQPTSGALLNPPSGSCHAHTGSSNNNDSTTSGHDSHRSSPRTTTCTPNPVHHSVNPPPPTNNNNAHNLPDHDHPVPYDTTTPMLIDSTPISTHPTTTNHPNIDHTTLHPLIRSLAITIANLTGSHNFQHSLHWLLTDPFAPEKLASGLAAADRAPGLEAENLALRDLLAVPALDFDHVQRLQSSSAAKESHISSLSLALAEAQATALALRDEVAELRALVEKGRVAWEGARAELEMKGRECEVLGRALEGAQRREREGERKKSGGGGGGGGLAASRWAASSSSSSPSKEGEKPCVISPAVTGAAALGKVKEEEQGRPDPVQQHVPPRPAAPVTAALVKVEQQDPPTPVPQQQQQHVPPLVSASPQLTSPSSASSSLRADDHHYFCDSVSACDEPSDIDDDDKDDDGGAASLFPAAARGVEGKRKGKVMVLGLEWETLDQW